MTRTENEQEFVLGNKQLLSAFFVVVMLLGVFFAMGYIVGHNTISDGQVKKTAPAESVVRKPDVYIAPLGAGMNREAARLARELRRHEVVAGLVVELGDESFRLKKSFEAADKTGARYLLIVGGDEVAADAFALKDLASGEQVTVPHAELAQRILRK